MRLDPVESFSLLCVGSIDGSLSAGGEGFLEGVKAAEPWSPWALALLEEERLSLLEEERRSIVI